MTTQAPSDFPRRVLLAVTGLSPQVVTETLYALYHQAPAFVPTEVYLITTREGEQRARLALLSDEPGWFHRFLRDHGLTGRIRFEASHIQVLTDASGQPLDDIRTPQDNERAADVITGWVRDLTADASSALHVSIAGGRKTMGYYLGYALSLFGRPQDRLSHVLVSEPFESSWEFFYPTPYERIIQVRGDKLANCQDARVTLAEIPFVRLREGLPPRLIQGRAPLSQIVQAANRALLPPRLELRVRSRKAVADDIPIELTDTEFCVLLWLAERLLAGRPEVDWCTPAARDEFLEVAGRVLNPMGGLYERMEDAFGWRKDVDFRLAKYFQPHKSRINKAFEEALGVHAARRFQIPRGSPNALPLEAHQVEISWES